MIKLMRTAALAGLPLWMWHSCKHISNVFYGDGDSSGAGRGIGAGDGYPGGDGHGDSVDGWGTGDGGNDV